ncbi:MAG: rhomboid family intramembrane serine protease [Candidatus Accumulibacter sp.]|jgi:hypothetical protein|nr:rhomboid family intramembrane serine protease [Candidatus Accumulibacter necessarius]
MAMYVSLYGRRRIRFFYQFLFYFDYVKAPAIILLPVWIAHELVQQQLDGQGGVAYMAHAGGFVTGALLIAWYRWRHQVTTVDLPEAATDDGFPAQQFAHQAGREEIDARDIRVARVSLVEATYQRHRGVGIPPAEGRLGQRQDRIRPLGQECPVHAAQALEQIQCLLGAPQAQQ